MIHQIGDRFFFLIFIFIFIACGSNKPISDVDTEGCQTFASVKDFTGLDGCGLMIVLDNGDKLLPAKINDPNFKLRNGQRIKLNYVELEDAVSICMAEKASINITCIELVEGKPIIKKCYDAVDAMEISWMKEVVNSTNPSSIRKYVFRTDGWAYIFSTRTKQLLYDCQGTLLCEHEGLGENQCIQKFLPNVRGELIYEN